MRFSYPLLLRQHFLQQNKTVADGSHSRRVGVEVISDIPQQLDAQHAFKLAAETNQPRNWGFLVRNIDKIVTTLTQNQKALLALQRVNKLAALEVKKDITLKLFAEKNHIRVEGIRNSDGFEMHIGYYRYPKPRNLSSVAG